MQNCRKTKGKNLPRGGKNPLLGVSPGVPLLPGGTYHVRWCKVALSCYSMQTFGEVAENTCRDERLSTCLHKCLLGSWDCPVHKPWTMSGVYWFGKEKDKDNEYFTSECRKF